MDGLRQAFALVSVNNEASQSELVDLIREIDEQIGHSNFEGLDTFLAEITPDQCSAISLVATLRATYPVRERVRNWAPLVEQTHKSLDERGKDGALILMGLLP